MKNKKAVFFTVLLVLTSFCFAEERVAVQDIAIDKLIDGVRVTIACSGEPDISSFVTVDPAAVVIDIMDALAQVPQDRITSNYYPVSAVTVTQSEAAKGVRVTILLRNMVRHRITNENGIVTVHLETEPMGRVQALESKDQFSGKPPLTLLVQDAELTGVLRMLARQFDLNLFITQDVKSIVSVRLNEVPLRAGVEALVKAGGCNMVEDKSGLIIVKPVKKEMFGELQTRVFNLDYVEAEDAIKAVKKVLSPSGDAVQGFRRVGTKAGAGSERSAILIVTDVAEGLDEVAKVIAELDRPVPQIAIEAKFIETTHSAEDRYGIDWTPVAAFSTELPKIGKEVAIPVVFQEMLLGKISFANFTAVFQVLMTRGNSRVLANPKTVTLDNQTATVSMGLNVPVREVNKDPNTGEITYTWKTRSIPISMEVTPHVTSDGMITMRVKPSVKAITGWVGSPDDRQPIVAEREAETQVKVAEDEVVVIGGLVKDEETRNVSKIPLLGDIPILGHLFKKTSIDRTKSDLMIFIIPHIINP